MTWDIIVRLSHIIGTVLGVGGATFAEIFYVKTLANGKIDETAGKFMGLTYTVLRLGTIILVLSGLGFLILSRLEGATQHIYGVRVWFKMILVLIIVLNALALQTRKIPFWLGGAISLTSWYMALILGAWRVRTSYLELTIWYIGAIIVVAFLQSLVRKYVTKEK